MCLCGPDPRQRIGSSNYEGEFLAVLLLCTGILLCVSFREGISEVFSVAIKLLQKICIYGKTLQLPFSQTRPPPAGSMAGFLQGDGCKLFLEAPGR